MLKIYKHKISQIGIHSIYWLFSLLFFLFYYNRYSELNSSTIVASLAHLFFVMITVYTFNYVIIPKFLLKRKHLQFLFLSLITIILFLYFQLLVTEILLIRLLYTKSILFPKTIDVVILIVNLAFIVLIGISIKLFKQWSLKERYEQELKKEKVEAELKMLKTQINPHFLFNTLNSIYVLALKNSQDTAETVLKLSNILDFILYKNNVERVLLIDELEIIKNYIELEKIRFGKRVTVSFTELIKDKTITIPPMIIIPLVENAFKHGVAKSMDKSWIKINIAQNESELKIEISNSRKETEETKKNQGIGLSNVQRRLELLYKENFEFIKTENTYTFAIKLIIKNTTYD